MEWILAIILGLWLLGRLSRWLLRRWVQRNFQPREQSRPSRREGTVSVEQTARPEKKVNRSVGEYVEFEEVEE